MVEEAFLYSNHRTLMRHHLAVSLPDYHEKTVAAAAVLFLHLLFLDPFRGYCLWRIRPTVRFLCSFAHLAMTAALLCLDLLFSWGMTITTTAAVAVAVST